MTAMQSVPEIPTSTNQALSFLRLASANLDDIQKVRIATKNRLAAAAREGGMMYGINDAVVENLDLAEVNAKAAVEQYYRSAVSPGVIAWQQEMPGVGALQLGRLLGVIGHPRVAVERRYYPNPDFDPEERSSVKNPKRLLDELPPRPRTVDQLWAYCGMGDPAVKHTKGMDSAQALRCGSPQAKTLAFRIVRQCRMSAPTGYYSLLVKEAKAHYADKHEDWKPGHNDMASLRRVAKYMLRDLHDAAEDWKYTTT